MPNLYRSELEAMQDSLINGSDGSPITAAQHRAVNSAMMDFANSFLPKPLTVNDDGNDPDEDGSFGAIISDKLEKRDVSTVVIVESNTVITPTGFEKDTASNTLYFRGGNAYVQGTDVIINFQQA